MAGRLGQPSPLAGAVEDPRARDSPTTVYGTVTAVLVGARKIAHLEDNLQAGAWSLATDEVAALDKVSARPLPYPYWHQRQYNAARYSRQP